MIATWQKSLTNFEYRISKKYTNVAGIHAWAEQTIRRTVMMTGVGEGGFFCLLSGMQSL